MPRTTTNKSFRQDNPTKARRRQPLNDGEVDDGHRTPGASGEISHRRRRPGRAASILSTSQRTRSQHWRDIGTGKLKRRANPASRTRSRPSAKRGPRK